MKNPNINLHKYSINDIRTIKSAIIDIKKARQILLNMIFITAKNRYNNCNYQRNGNDFFP